MSQILITVGSNVFFISSRLLVSRFPFHSENSPEKEIEDKVRLNAGFIDRYSIDRLQALNPAIPDIILLHPHTFSSTEEENAEGEDLDSLLLQVLGVHSLFLFIENLQ